MATIYAIKHKRSKSITGRYRGIVWQDGLALFGDPRERDQKLRYLGGRAVDIEVPLSCTCGKEEKVCSCLTKREEIEEAEATEEKPKEKLDYQGKLEKLKEAKEEGVFDWWEFTDGSRSKKNVNRAYKHLQSL